MEPLTALLPPHKAKISHSLVWRRNWILYEFSYKWVPYVSQTPAKFQMHQVQYNSIKTKAVGVETHQWKTWLGACKGSSMSSIKSCFWWNNQCLTVLLNEASKFDDNYLAARFLLLWICERPDQMHTLTFSCINDSLFCSILVLICDVSFSLCFWGGAISAFVHVKNGNLRASCFTKRSMIERNTCHTLCLLGEPSWNPHEEWHSIKGESWHKIDFLEGWCRWSDLDQ